MKETRECPGKTPEDAAQQLSLLWQQGERPDVRQFLERAGGLPPAEVAAVLRVDQVRRWQAGERVPAEAYLQAHPGLRMDPERAFELIYGEFLLREGLGERPRPEEFAVRFPQFAARLEQQAALHEALGEASSPGPGPTLVAPGSPTEKLPDTPHRPPGGPGSWPAPPGYEILGELGRGGMGVVYQARQLSLNRLVALKTVLAAEHAGLQERARFRTEAEAVARLQHPNIVQIYEVGEHEGRPYLSLELVDGGSLAQKLDGTPLPPGEAAGLLETLARAVHAAHQRGIVHRDLKPANILLSRKSESGIRKEGRKAEADSECRMPTSEFDLKVTDFGLAKTLEGEPGALAPGGLTTSGAILGTPSYMAPEQAGGKSRDIGPAADVYALGAILYELLTGRPPFRAPSPLDTLMQVVSEEPVPPRRLLPRLPRDLETICLKCLAKDPRRRYPSAEALADDLRRFRDGRPILARRVGPVERLVKWARRRPAAAAVAGMGLLAVPVALAAVVWYDRQLQETRSATRAAALVQSLASADTRGVPRIVDELGPYRRWADPLLKHRAADVAADSPERLHLGLALVPVDPVQVEYLAGRVLTAGPHELPVLLDALRDHRAELAPRFADVLRDRRADGARRFRAACALAAYDPESPAWADCRRDVAERLLAENPITLGEWTEVLRPVRGVLVEPLVATFRDVGRPESERYLATTLLAEYAADRPEVLAGLIVEADPRQYAQLWPGIRAHRDRAIEFMNRELDRAPPAECAEADRDALARRQAQAAVVLLQLGTAERVWPLLRHRPDPRVATFLIHRLGLLGADPRVLVQRLGEEPDPSARRTLLLCLGEFPEQRLAAADREPLLAGLFRAYHENPDPGFRAAAEWLLRRWNRGEELKAIDRDRRAAEPRNLPFWYANGQGQTLVVLGPGEFLMGSPAGEPGRSEEEDLHREHIAHRFAIGVKKVSVEQFQRFLRASPAVRHSYPRKYSPSPDGPIVSVTWFEAAQYCRWLSEQEGIPNDQMCYPPVADIKEGMRVPADYRERTGYRLPTEAEWEFACRAGTVTSRYYGSADELLDRYAWYARNANDRAWPSGLLKPNAFGLFDMHGNVWEWCQDPPPAPGKEASAEERRSALDPQSRFCRGGSFVHQPSAVRSAARLGLPATSRLPDVGLRVVRTWKSP